MLIHKRIILAALLQSLILTEASASAFKRRVISGYSGDTVVDRVAKHINFNTIKGIDLKPYVNSISRNLKNQYLINGNISLKMHFENDNGKCTENKTMIICKLKRDVRIEHCDISRGCGEFSQSYSSTISWEKKSNNLSLPTVILSGETKETKFYSR